VRGGGYRWRSRGERVAIVRSWGEHHSPFDSQPRPRGAFPWGRPGGGSPAHRAPRTREIAAWPSGTASAKPPGKGGSRSVTPPVRHPRTVKWQRYSAFALSQNSLGEEVTRPVGRSKCDRILEEAAAGQVHETEVLRAEPLGGMSRTPPGRPQRVAARRASSGTCRGSGTDDLSSALPILAVKVGRLESQGNEFGELLPVPYTVTYRKGDFFELELVEKNSGEMLARYTREGGRGGTAPGGPVLACRWGPASSSFTLPGTGYFRSGSAAVPGLPGQARGNLQRPA